LNGISTRAFRGNLKWLMERLPSDIPLGLYECPAPYRRLLTDEELKICIDSGRFVLIKDVSCDPATFGTVGGRWRLLRRVPTNTMTLYAFYVLSAV
jgi:dihydrodipicolinate synthase/N-acetylneuraminate lyase